jgi:hypothetical protein
MQGSKFLQDAGRDPGRVKGFFYFPLSLTYHHYDKCLYSLFKVVLVLLNGSGFLP